MNVRTCEENCVCAPKAEQSVMEIGSLRGRITAQLAESVAQDLIITAFGYVKNFVLYKMV